MTPQSKTLEIDLFWSFRSPYSYLATRRLRALQDDYDLHIHVRPVLPLAVRVKDFFKKTNPKFARYTVMDCFRNAQHLDLPFAPPRPDPIVQDMSTLQVAKDQPYIYRVTRLGVEAASRGRGMPYLDEMSSMIWGGVENWNSDENMKGAAERAGLDLAAMEQAIGADVQKYDDAIAANQKALDDSAHWGVPTMVFEGETFFGQDRIDLLVWRMQQKGLERR